MIRYFLVLSMLMAGGYSQEYRFYQGCGMDWAKCFTESSASRYLAGGSNSFEWGAADIWITRIDLNGTPLWSRTYRVDHNYDAPNCIAVSPDQRIWVGYNYHFLMQIDTVGNLIRSMDFGSDIFIDRMFATLGGNMLVHGTRYDPASYDRHPMLMILDTTGAVLDAAWYKVQEGNLLTSETVPFSSGFQQPDSSFTFAGTGYFPDLPFLLHLKKDLTPAWHVSIDKLCNGEIALLPAADGGYFLNSLSSDTLLYHRHPILIKTDSSGTPTLVRTYNIDSNRWYTNADKPKFAMKGHSLYIGGNVDGPAFDHSMVLSLDTSGIVRWCKEYGHPSYRYDMQDMMFTGDSVRLFCTSNADTVVNLLSPYGIYQEDELVFGTDTIGNAPVVSVTLPVAWMDHHPDTTHYPVVMTRFTPATMVTTLIVDTAFTEVTDSSLCIGVNIGEPQPIGQLPELFPNPSAETAFLRIPDTGCPGGTISVFDMAGKLLDEIRVTSGELVPLQAPDAGIYLILVPGLNGSTVIRWVVTP